MSATTLSKCPLCDQPATFKVGYDSNTLEGISGGDCARCGSVHIADGVIREFREKNELYLLSAFFRRHSGKPPLVQLSNAKELLSGLHVCTRFQRNSMPYWEFS